MADLKDELSASLVARLADEIVAAWPSFERDRFATESSEGLADRELKARIAWIAERLADTMPTDLDDAAAVIRSVVAADGMQAWASLPVTSYVALAMIERPALALPLLAELTSRFSSELDIRCFLERHPAVTMEHLHRWVDDPSEHVRRLVSEGTRPRLPWAPPLRSFIADPTPTITLLDRLFDDESVYVRRSVANHLNDISKDHPRITIDVARRWLAATTHGDYVVRHGLRSLVKKGHPDALALLGFDQSAMVELTALTVDRSAIVIGDTVTLTMTLVADEPTRVAVDYVVFYVGANGTLKAGKVFKLAVRELAAGMPVTIVRRHGFGHVSIRRIHPGEHRIGVQVNGCILGFVDVLVSD